MRRAERLAIALLAAAVATTSGAAAQETEEAEQADPHAQARSQGTIPGVFEPPEDVEQPDPTLPPGSIAVDLLDGDGKPVADEMVTLGILINSIAKGDSRKHLTAKTDTGGHAVFSGLELASNVAYRVSAGFQGGAFAAAPFQLEHAKAMHVVLHVYPVTRDLQRALIVAEATVAAEVREERLQLEEVLTLYNLGRWAWQPDNVRIALPDGFTAFNAQTTMSDQGVDETAGAARLRGTFPPGRHTIDFRWQLPLSGERDIEFAAGLPPHVAGARVVMLAAPGIDLTAHGFPPAEIRRDAQGRRFLVLERRLRPEDPKLTALTIGIHGLPVPGPERWVATLLAACGVAAGLALSRRASDPKTGSPLRSALLEELEDLERSRIAGDVGPKTYERIRRELVDALALTLSARA